MVTNYTLGIERDPSTESLLKSLYKADDFYSVFDTLRYMVSGYLFNQTAFTTISKDAYIHGYPEKRLQMAFNNTLDYFYGMEVDMPDYVTPVLVESSKVSAA